METPSLGMTVTLNVPFDAAYERTVAALKANGFGVITEVDMQATFKNKLGADFRPYRILGACNPSFAYRALNVTADVGLLLPCNVTVSANDDGTTDVMVVNPLAMLSLIHDDQVQPIAAEIYANLNKAMAALRS